MTPFPPPPRGSAPAPTAAALRSTRGAALRAARNLAGLSAKKLADRVNERTQGGNPVSKDAIYAYEAGKVLLPHEVGVRLAAVLGLHPGELLAGDPDFRAPNLRDPAGDPADLAAPAATDQTRPAASTPIARWLKLAKQPAAVARVLARILDARPMGDTGVQGFMSVFQLLQADLKAVTTHPVADTVRNAQRREGWDTLANTLTAAEGGLEILREDFRELFKKDPDLFDAQTTAERIAERLRGLAVELETAAVDTDRLYKPAD